MPTTHPSGEPPKPRARGDMYLRAEQRHRTESTATRLTEIRTPPAPPVYESVSLEAAGAAAAPAGATAPPIGAAASPASAAAPPIGAAAAPAAIAPAPVAIPNVEHQPVLVTPAASLLPRAHRRRKQEPVFAAAAFATLAVLAAMAIVATIRPDNTIDAPRLTQAPAPRAGTPVSTPAPEQSEPSLRVTAPAVAATPAIGTAKPVVRVSREAAVMPVSTASEGRIRVTSTPPGARVTVNGIGWGQTPLTIAHLPFGAKTVRVTREGYTAQQRSVDIRGERPSATLHVTLTRGRR